MRREEIVRLLRAQPFQPFLICLSNGMRYPIRHPDMAIATLSAVYIGVPGAGHGLADDILIASLVHVVTLEYLPVVAGGNGSQEANP